jgi:uncharacterized membrane protein YhdT
MKSSLTLLFFIAPCVSSFIAANTKGISLAVRQQSLSAPQSLLFLHVQPIPDHRDTLVKLDDPIMSMTDEHTVAKHDEQQLERFTHHIAPIVLALYLIGHYLSTYHAPLTEGHVNIDPMFGGGILIGTGLYLLRSSIDSTFLSPA